MEPVRVRNWKIRGTEIDELPNHLEQTAKMIISTTGISPLAAKALALRGVTTPEEAEEFINGTLASLPDPFLMDHMDKAVVRIAKAIKDGEKISVHGDYDVDGVTGAALLVESLTMFGAECEFHIPLRLRDGYGLSAEALKESAENGCKLAISVDCGITALEEADLAKELGLDLIITDHHQEPPTLPDAYAIINPHKSTCQFPYKEVAGVGVAFFLMVGLRKHLKDTGAITDNGPDLRYVLDLVALGTVADIVPLRGPNRVMTRVGLNLLSGNNRPGVTALRTVSGVKKVTAGSVGFQLAPRLNAAGRIEDARLGADLLLMGQDGDCTGIANALDGFNAERKAIENETLKQAIERIESDDFTHHKSIVLADERWHPGVIGIVASRLVERYHRPTVLIAIDTETGIGKGSARSIKNFHMFKGFQECGDLLVGFGGHEHAAGLSIEATNADAFAKKFESTADKWLTEEDLIPNMPFDGVVSIDEITVKDVEELDSLAPFGAGNPGPTFVTRGVSPEAARLIGADKTHVSFFARQGLHSVKCIAWKMADRIEEFDGPLDIMFSADINEWQGKRSVQLEIKDIKQSKASNA